MSYLFGYLLSPNISKKGQLKDVRSDKKEKYENSLRRELWDVRGDEQGELMRAGTLKWKVNQDRWEYNFESFINLIAQIEIVCNHKKHLVWILVCSESLKFIFHIKTKSLKYINWKENSWWVEFFPNLFLKKWNQVEKHRLWMQIINI